MGVVLFDDLYVEQGVDYPAPSDPAQYEWRSGDPDPVTGLPPLVDLTGCTATLKARAYPESTTALLTLTSGAGITLGGAAGTVKIAITAAQSNAMPAGAFPYDLLITTAGGVTTKFLSGKLNVRATVAR